MYLNIIKAVYDKPTANIHIELFLKDKDQDKDAHSHHFNST